MKKIYIVLTYTGTILSRVIRVVRRDEFTHVSISLDENLEEMYSFGRLNPYIAFIGGFVHESCKYGTFKRFKNTKSEIFYIEVTDEQYKKIKKKIKYFKRKKGLYRFNLIGLMCVAINRRVSLKNQFYCAEFIKYLLESAKISNNLPSIVSPIDFLNIDNIKTVYRGYLRNYNIN